MDQVLFDEVETTRTRHIGFITEGRRFDFTLTYSDLFCGKTMVTCLQSNKSALLDGHDVDNLDYLGKTYNLNSIDTGHLANFLKVPLSDPSLNEQY